MNMKTCSLKSGIAIAAGTVWLAFASIAAPGVFAQGSSDEHEAEGEAASEMKADMEMSAIETSGDMYGDVMAVNTGLKTLLVRESRYGNDLYAFTTNPQTTFTNADSLADLHNGDYVNVDYYVMDDNKIAESVNVEERAHKEEDTTKITLQKVLVD